MLKARAIDDERAQQELAARQKAQEDADVTAAFGRHKLPNGAPDYDAIVNTLAPKYPALSLKMQGVVADARKKSADAQSVELKNTVEKYDMGLRLAQGIVDQNTLDAIRPQIATISPEFAELLGPTYDQARVGQLGQIAFTAKELYTQRQEALAAWSKGDVDGGFLRYIKTAANDEEYQQFKEQARALGVPGPVVDGVPATWSPEAIQQIEAMSLSAKDQADIADKDADNAAAATNAANVEADRQARLKIAQSREARLASGGAEAGAGTAGLTPAAQEATRRAAESWKATQLAALARAKRGYVDGYATVPPMPADAVKAEEDRIESSYRSMAGLPEPADNPAFPRGVQDYVQQLKAKYETFEEADEELSRASADLKADHPNMNEAEVRKALGRAFGRASAAGSQPQQREVRVKASPSERAKAKEILTKAGFKGITDNDPRIDVFLANEKNRRQLGLK